MIRPTSDRVREAVFNIIGGRVNNARVLDLFAGTGALSLEALSRGCEFVLLVDNAPKALNIIRKNIEMCGFSARSSIIRGDLAKGLFFVQKKAPPKGFNLVFLDPPYKKNMAPAILGHIAASECIDKNALIVVEESAGEKMPDRIEGLVLQDNRRYGDTGIWFYAFYEQGEHSCA